MSFGDRKHTEKLGERDYDRAMHDVRFQSFLNRGFQVSYAYDIPYLGGYNLDGSIIYIDRSTPAAFRRGNRVYQVRPNGLVEGIITHEHWEKTAILAWGYSYDTAHELATHAENHFAAERLRIDPDEYEAMWKPMIAFCERKLHQPGIQLPPDLDMTPYKAAA